MKFKFKFKCNRFAIVPHRCFSCNEYFWMGPYRRTDIFFHDRFIKGNICRDCLPKYYSRRIHPL